MKNQLAAWRKEKGLTQKEVAAAVGKTGSAVYSWENCVFAPSIDDVVVLAKLFGRTAAEVAQAVTCCNVGRNTDKADGPGRKGMKRADKYATLDWEEAAELNKLSKLFGVKEEKYKPQPGGPTRLCGECRNWRTDPKRTEVEGIRVSLRLGTCKADGKKHDRCQRACEMYGIDVQKKRDGSERGQKGRPGPGKKRVMCVETGVVYENARKAAETFGAGKSHKNVNEACRGERKSAGGYHWVYVED